MTIKETMPVLKSCISYIAVARIKFSYNEYFEMLFPISMSNELFLSVIDRDFVLDGYTVRKIADITEIKDIRQTYLKIHALEGNFKKLSPPNLNVNSWRDLFSSLIPTRKYVIVEGTVPNTNHSFFTVGMPVAIGQSAVKFRSFDGAGNWSEETINIPFSAIHSVTIDSSYVSTYSKYVKHYVDVKEKTNN